MMKHSDEKCCSSDCQTSSNSDGKKRIVIDFLYLDLSVCKRCQGAESSLAEAVEEVAVALESAGYQVVINKVNIDSKERAIEYEFLSSPTIRVNGEDIELEVRESGCEDCGKLCGDSVDCRLWTYDGLEYLKPPKAMIVNSILKAVYGGHQFEQIYRENYVLPKNLEVFFDGNESDK